MTAGGPLEYDPYSYELDVDPYPVYRRMLVEAPVYRNERLDFFALTRFQHCLDAFLDWRTYSSAKGTVLELMDEPMVGPLIIFMDPPRQTRLRNLVSKAFTPRRIAALEPAIREIARGYLDAIVGRGDGRCDIVAEFTAKLPMDVISTLLGIPPADRDTVRGWSNDLLHRDPGNPMPTAQGLASMKRLSEYFADAIRERRARPRDDIMTLLTQAEVTVEDGEPERLSDREIVAFFNLLATAGNETVTKFLGTAYHLLARYPDQRKRLVDDPPLCRNAVEETLRYEPPSQYQGRVLTRDAEVDGTVIPKDAKLLIINGASGRDPRKFEDPERYDVGRRIDMHLGLGHGQHICLGASLARLESRIALEELLARVPEYEVPEDGIQRMHSSNVRGYSGLVLEYPATAGA